MITGHKQGLGNAYKRGFEFALTHLKADIVFQMDSDGQHDARLIPKFLDYIEKGFDLIIGSRFVQGGSTPDFSLWRKFLSAWKPTCALCWWSFFNKRLHIWISMY